MIKTNSIHCYLVFVRADKSSKEMSCSLMFKLLESEFKWKTYMKIMNNKTVCYLVYIIYILSHYSLLDWKFVFKFFLK